MKNTQKTEHRSDSPLLQVHSIFNTIQGEGPFSGTPCMFIRLAGCNLQCPNCDTDYTSKRKELTVDQICEAIYPYQKKGLVVITGGEPFRQNIGNLIETLVLHGYYVQIETNGTIAPTDGKYNTNTSSRKGCYIVVSPKTEKIQQIYSEIACAFKYVVAAHKVSNEDGLPTEVLGFPVRRGIAKPTSEFQGLIYIQPEDSHEKIKNRLNQTSAVISCAKHGYILNLQIHKILGLE